MPTIPTEVRVPQFLGNAHVGSTTKAVPQPGAGELLLKVKANALCGSERPQYYKGTETTPGHEAAGVVVAAGQGTSVEVGTPGVVFLMDFCGECRSCHHGFTNQCLAKRGDMGFNRDGGYGVYELVHESNFFATSADLPFSEATMLLDVMGTGGHAIKRSLMVHSDIQSVLVTGAGPIGLGVLAMAKLLLGRDVPILISDVVPYRLQLAEQMGGLPILVTDRSLEKGLQLHGVDAPDVVIDCAGKASVREEALSLLAHRGVFVSVAHGEGLSVQDIYRDFVFRELSLLGSEYFAYHELKDNLDLLRANRGYLGQIITHRFGIEEIKTAFDLFFQGETGKVIIEQ